MKDILVFASRRFLRLVGRVVSGVFLDVRVVGRSNLPSGNEPLILIANHFSWFDAPLLTVLLPFEPVFLVATESQRKLSVRLFIALFNGIPIWRGQVDRRAFRAARMVLKEGGVLGVFPEGGIDPELAQKVASGDVIVEDHYAHASRRNAQLTRPRPGTAFLAVQCQARILPVGLLGTEKIVGHYLNWRNLIPWRRVPVTLMIGPAFGPLQLDPALRGHARRQHLDEMSDAIMQHIAELFPPEHRGPYRA